MVLTPSMMVDLGTPVPTFELPAFNGNLVSSADFVDAQGLLLAVICPHCPFVKHLRIGLAQFARDYIERGMKIAQLVMTPIVAFRAQEKTTGSLYEEDITISNRGSGALGSTGE